MISKMDTYQFVVSRARNARRSRLSVTKISSSMKRAASLNSPKTYVEIKDCLRSPGGSLADYFINIPFKPLYPFTSLIRTS